MLENLKKTIWKLNLELPKNNLITMTSGNVSARDPQTNLVVIKPSGIAYEDLQPEDMIVVNMEGEIIEGTYKPSVDTETHLYVYRNRPDVHGVVHTHSPYATSFAVIGQEIPPVTTVVCDIFGGPVPVGPYARIGGNEIGKAIVEHIGDSTAILLQNHGVFTIGKTAKEAVKAAVVVEDVAKIIHLAQQKGDPIVIPAEEVQREHEFYQTAYGQ